MRFQLLCAALLLSIGSADHALELVEDRELAADGPVELIEQAAAPSVVLIQLSPVGE